MDTAVGVSARVGEMRERESNAGISIDAVANGY